MHHYQIRDIKIVEPGVRERAWKNNVIKNHMGFQEDVKNMPLLQGPDPVLQEKTGIASVRSIDVNFEGVNNLSGVAPPDTDGDVGPDHYMQMVNLAFAIYDKNGNLQYGPADNSTIWDGFIGSWTGTNDGDPIVLYDEYADRWMASQFAINTSDGTQWELVAISATGDPTGSWYRYAFQFDYMPDYPKLGIWPDGYYISVNQFQKVGGSYYWKGAGAAVMNRDKMLAGDPTAEMVFFDLGTTYSSLLPADADGANLPPAGSPNYFTRFTSGALQVWALDVDWNNTSNSTLTKLPNVSVATFSNSGFTINQPGTSTTLDDLADRLMYRLQYRNFGSHQAMVTNHTVNNGSGKAAVRWYELRNYGSGWTLHQQGTYGPNDGNHRWMASIAMNAYGDIGLGFSVSGSSTYPSIRFTGRNSDDPPGQMTISETSIINGTKSQTGVSRWGDYSCMSVDPVNQSTFWFTSEYSNGGWNWRTRVASFDITPPNALFPPQNLSAEVVGQTVDLTWIAPMPSNNTLLGYNVYRDTQKINQALIQETSYPDGNVPYGIHEYHVTAVYSESESTPSNAVEVTVGVPEISVSPLSLSEELNPGQASAKTLTIQNTGQLDLTVNLETELTLNDNTQPVIADPELYQQMVQNRIEEFGHTIGEVKLQEPMDGYCVPSANCSWGDGFTDFSTGSINNASSGCSAGGYGNFTAMSTEMEVGMNYSVTFRTGYSRQYVSLWIDFNENKIFEDAERLLTDYYLRYSNQYYTTQITIPSEAENGEKRMR
ncbi:MAG: GEVED domain-containing protein, partial [Bacteroidota bacterium]